MNSAVLKHLSEVKEHLYINPLEKCNLKCKICYTQKTAPILSESQILKLVADYSEVQKLQTITFCGGEVFALPYFPNLVNTLTNQGIFIQIITNGTIDKLDQFKTPNLVNLIVSLDGLPEYHDSNRGQGNFQKSIEFLKKSLTLGFHNEVFSIVTRQNYPEIDNFESYLNTQLGKPTLVTYHPRKPPRYLMHHPISNVVGETTGFDFLSREQMLQVVKERNVFPPKNLGCYQISVMSTGKIYGCCEGIRPLGDLNDPIEYILHKLDQRIEEWSETNKFQKCLGCSDYKFMCGIKEYLEVLELENNQYA
jgi:MoaA/NifB/PqqE/SkfB family radical SAM enzyme